jgi:hypothetical protein
MHGVSFCYNTLIAEMHSVPFVTPHMTNQIAEIHGRNLELRCSLYEHMIAEMPSVLFVTSPTIAAMH